MWPFVVSLAILRRELGGLRWPSIKKWIWLNLRSLTASYFPRFGLRLGNLRLPFQASDANGAGSTALFTRSGSQNAPGPDVALARGASYLMAADPTRLSKTYSFQVI